MFEECGIIDKERGIIRYEDNETYSMDDPDRS